MNPWTRWRQNRCGKRRPGHHYSVEMLGTGDTFVVDPVNLCSSCGFPLPEEFIDAAVADVVREGWM